MFFFKLCYLIHLFRMFLAMPYSWQGLANTVATSCQAGGKLLPSGWQNFANEVAKLCQPYWQNDNKASY